MKEYSEAEKRAYIAECKKNIAKYNKLIQKVEILANNSANFAQVKRQIIGLQKELKTVKLFKNIRQDFYKRLSKAFEENQNRANKAFLGKFNELKDRLNSGEIKAVYQEILGLKEHCFVFTREKRREYEEKITFLFDLYGQVKKKKDQYLAQRLDGQKKRIKELEQEIANCKSMIQKIHDGKSFKDTWERLKNLQKSVFSLRIAKEIFPEKQRLISEINGCFEIIIEKRNTFEEEVRKNFQYFNEKIEEIENKVEEVRNEKKIDGLIKEVKCLKDEIFENRDGRFKRVLKKNQVEEFKQRIRNLFSLLFDKKKAGIEFAKEASLLFKDLKQKIRQLLLDVEKNMSLSACREFTSQIRIMQNEVKKQRLFRWQKRELLETLSICWQINFEKRQILSKKEWSWEWLQIAYEELQRTGALLFASEPPTAF